MATNVEAMRRSAPVCTSCRAHKQLMRSQRTGKEGLEFEFAWFSWSAAVDACLGHLGGAGDGIVGGPMGFVKMLIMRWHVFRFGDVTAVLLLAAILVIMLVAFVELPVLTGNW